MTIFDVHQTLSLSGFSFVCLFDWESEEERESEKEASGCWIKFLLAYSFAHGVFSYCYCYDYNDDNDDRRWMRCLAAGWLAGYNMILNEGRPATCE